MTQTPEFLDGNAAAGDLAQLFGTDMTRASGPCLGCGDHVVLAEAHAFLGGPGTVLRCPHCESVLLRLVQTSRRTWLETSGLGHLQLESRQ
jgi:Family of unknown function (DUF6510)